MSNIEIESYYTTYNIVRNNRITKYQNKIFVSHYNERRRRMVFNTGAALLDAIVLAVVAKEPEGTYGYKITQDVRSVIELSESTLYPVLRRLQKDDCLVTYDKQINGRNRRYYKITDRGDAQLNLYRSEWLTYASKVSGIFHGESSVSKEEENNEQS